MTTAKIYTTIPQQLAILRARGMTLDKTEASAWLEHVGYYRLSGYWYPYRLPSSQPRERLDQFMPGTNFHDIALLYEFDRKLRGRIFDGIERLEVALRAQIAAHVAALSPLAYRDQSTFRTAFAFQQWLDTVDSRVERAQARNDAIRHWYSHHEVPPPLWVVLEVLDFSDISIMYSGLPTATQWDIADNLGLRIDLTALSKTQRAAALKRHPLTRWLQQVTIARNACAHHARLWNQHFLPVSTAALRTNTQLSGLPTRASKQLYGIIELITAVLAIVSPGSTWRNKTDQLITNTFAQIPGRSLSEIGYPETTPN